MDATKNRFKNFRYFCISFIYHVSVNNYNSLNYINLPNVNGLFIGRSAWVADNFSLIID
ncbi:MAG: triose-phosphate isomerase [Clostridiaceae bacterium]|nr:triose-phosphate isomerase [Clostridiaceae bacterium]